MNSVSKYIKNKLVGTASNTNYETPENKKERKKARKDKPKERKKGSQERDKDRQTPEDYRCREDKSTYPGVAPVCGSGCLGAEKSSYIVRSLPLGIQTSRVKPYL